MTFLAALVWTCPAAGSALCRGRNGAVVVREACKPRAAIDLVGTGTAVPGDPGPRGASHPRLRAFDATGKLIGPVTAAGEIILVDAGRGFTAAAGGDGFVTQGTFYHEAAGCLGPRFLFDDGSLVLRAVVEGTTAYRPGDSVATRNFQSFASFLPASLCTSPGATYDAASGTCCSPSTLTFSSGQAVGIDLSGFSPPFRVEVER
jgi:hypothetical protein